jgi:hypothetical protein
MSAALLIKERNKVCLGAAALVSLGDTAALGEELERREAGDVVFFGKILILLVVRVDVCDDALSISVRVSPSINHE